MASAEKRGLQDRVHYLGVKDRTGVVEAIRHCDLGVVPNHRNTFTEINTPTRIFEYLSLGKPVVAPRTLGIEDYFGKDTLLFFEAGDSRDLARKSSLPTSTGKRRPASWSVVRRFTWPTTGVGRKRTSSTRSRNSVDIELVAGKPRQHLQGVGFSIGQSMIGVVAHDAARAVIREFFELFKTPWEFCRPGIAYDVLLCSGSEFVDNSAQLVVVYGSGQTRLMRKRESNEQRVAKVQSYLTSQIVFPFMKAMPRSQVLVRPSCRPKMEKRSDSNSPRRAPVWSGSDLIFC